MKVFFTSITLSLIFLSPSLAQEYTFIQPYNNMQISNMAEYNTPIGSSDEWIKGLGVINGYHQVQFENVATEGTYLLFDDWDQDGLILVGNQRYLISSVNYHLGRNELISRISNDSIFVYDLNSLEQFNLGDMSFKKFPEYNSSNKFLEVLYESNDISLLKEHYVKLVSADPSPLLDTFRNRLVKKENYLVYKKGSLSHFKPRKNNYLDFIPKSMKKEFISKVKKANLSFRDESDAPKIMQIIDNISQSNSREM